MKQIGLKLLHLKSFGIQCPSDQFSDVFHTINNHFKHMKRLEIVAHLPHEFEFSTQSLSRCHKLTHIILDLGYYEFEICNQFMEEISKYCVKLRELSVRPIVVTDGVLNALSMLTQLETIKLIGNTEHTYTQTSIDTLIQKCFKIKSIELKYNTINL